MTTVDASYDNERARSVIGRPVATSHAQIEAAAFRLFETYGFTNTTMESIAAELGVGRRTLFRYFESKNDIPWGQFAQSLDSFRSVLDATAPDVPLVESVHRAVVAFNDFGLDATGQHRTRMQLILTTPALQAHSVLKYAEWRQVIADYVAKRTGQDAGEPLPRIVGHVSLGLALSAYESWLEHEDTNLLVLIDQAMSLLNKYLRP
ncbi:MAG: mftR [Marmoricola sp.]|nr:mftR [Marmoricola sp.]